MKSVVVRLPRGFHAADGSRVHEAALRPARARDELRALTDYRAVIDPERFGSILLARVVTRLGTSEHIDPKAIERLAPEDRAALEEAYLRMNGYTGRER